MNSFHYKHPVHTDQEAIILPDRLARATEISNSLWMQGLERGCKTRPSYREERIDGGGGGFRAAVYDVTLRRTRGRVTAVLQAVQLACALCKAARH